MSKVLNQLLTDPDESGIFRCGACGCQFDFDVHSEINLEFDEEKGCLTEVCPACGNGSPLQRKIDEADRISDERKEGLI